MQDCTQVTCVKPNTSLLPVTSVPSGGIPPETWILCNTTHLKPTSSSSPCKQLCVLKQADLNTDSPDNLLSLIRCLLSFPFGFSAINWQSETEFARWDVGDVSKRHLTEQFMAKLWTPAGSSGAKIYIYIFYSLYFSFETLQLIRFSGDEQLTMLRKIPTLGHHFSQVTGEDSGKDLMFSCRQPPPFARCINTSCWTTP